MLEPSNSSASRRGADRSRRASAGGAAAALAATLSLLDQLIAGSDPTGRATGTSAPSRCSGTPGALLDEVVTAFAAHDAGAAFAAIDRVVQTGQDPRRFVDDLLERLRDLIIVAATGEGAGRCCAASPPTSSSGWPSGLAFGTDRLAHRRPRRRHPRRHERGDLSAPAARAARGASARAHRRCRRRPAARSGCRRPPRSLPPPPRLTLLPPRSCRPRRARPEAPTTPVVERASAASESKRPDPRLVADPEPTPASPAPAPVAPSGPVTLAQVRDAWPEILQRLEPVSRSSWMIAVDATPVAFADDVLTLSFRTQADVAAFKKLAAGKGPSEDLRGAIRDVLGIRVKYVARFDADATAEPPASGSPTPPADGPRADGGPLERPAPTAASGLDRRRPSHRPQPRR
jgi:DNA polymerase-3 subunit gamma/tau